MNVGGRDSLEQNLSAAVTFSTHTGGGDHFNGLRDLSYLLKGIHHNESEKPHLSRFSRPFNSLYLKKGIYQFHFQRVSIYCIYVPVYKDEQVYNTVYNFIELHYYFIEDSI